MVGGCGSDAPRLLGGAAKQPDTFQETGGKHFLGLNPRQHSLHQEERNERAREGGKDEGGGVRRRPRKKTDRRTFPSNYVFKRQNEEDKIYIYERHTFLSLRSATLWAQSKASSDFPYPKPRSLAKGTNFTDPK